jgi:hypothetical protein
MKRAFITICSFMLLLMPWGTRAATVSPSTLELSGARGEVVETMFSILNTGTSDQTYYVDVLDFGPVDETGTPQFFEVEEGASDLTSWIQFLTKEVAVPAQTAIDVPVNIVLPDDIPSGGYYAAITVANAPADVIADNGAIIEAKTAILVLLTVEGETVEKIALLDLVGPEDGGIYGDYTFRIQNQGNVHVTPEGSLMLTGALEKAFLTTDANASGGRVLPATTRSYTVTVEDPSTGWVRTAWEQLTHGVFSGVNAQLQIEGGNETQVVEINIQRVSWELFSTFAGLMALLLILFKFRKRK